MKVNLIAVEGVNMAKRSLKIVSRLQGNNRALKNGDIMLPDFNLSFEEVDPLTKAFRRMVREGAYDVSEMALTTYITAKAYGARMTAIPVFLVRDFHHKAIVAGQSAGIASAKDLEGRRVGVNRGYTVTTSVWARAILAEEHGVDLSKITWARSGEEHVADWRPPANVESLGGTGTLEEQLARGDVDAAVGLTAGEGTRALIPDAFNAGVVALKSRGLYPINHLVVVHDDVLAEVPDVAAQLFNAFSASKRIYVDDLKGGRISTLSAIDKVHLAALEVMDDPLPYGIAPNQRVLETLMAQAVSQGIIDGPIALQDLFASATLDLTG
jgi:4,5-dihydroxyphthalate decarboxylase